MSYKIAVASSDGKQIDETFGAAKKFIIYEVTEGLYKKLEERFFHEEKTEQVILDNGKGNLEEKCGDGNACENSNGCQRRGCAGAKEASAKVEFISDCRCIVCRKIGFHIQKQLERKAISAFDVSCPVEEALEKITYYFNRIDNHESLRAQK